MLGKFMCAFGYGIKNLSEGNLLYDSVATKGGDGLYTKIDSKGGSMYYILEGTASLIAGYLFVINNSNAFISALIGLFKSCVNIATKFSFCLLSFLVCI